MAQKICLVTGANSGIGKEISLMLAAAGAHVIMVCRNAEKGHAALEEIKAATGSKTIDLLIADLSSQVAIRKLADTIHERYSLLHVLINNAGVVLTEKKLSEQGIEMTLATNYLGPFLLTHLLLDLLKKAAPSRVINISSNIHTWARLDLDDLQSDRRKYSFMKAYAQSKLLMNIFTFEMARRMDGTGVSVNCVHPGAVRTGLGSESANNPVLKFVDRIVKMFFISSHKAAKAPFMLATSAQMEGVSGKYFQKDKDVPASRQSYDPVLAKKVWEISTKMTGL